MRSLSPACIECGQYVTARNPVTKGVGSHGGIMILGDSTSYLEDDKDMVFSGSVGKWLYRELLDVGVDMESCYLTKAVKCFSPKTYTSKTIKACRELLIAEVEDVKPKYILALGSTALNVLIGKGNVSTHRGKTFEFHGAQVLPTHHPSTVIRQPSKGWEFRADLTYFARMCEGSWKPPEDFKWEFIDDLDRFNYMEVMLNRADVMSYDIETTSLKDTKTGKLLMIGFAIEDKCFVVPLESEHSSLYRAGIKVWGRLQKLLIKNGTTKVAQNAKFDNRWLRSRGVEPYVDFDTYLASYIINVTVPHGLKFMAKTYLGASDYDSGIEFKEKLSKKEYLEMANYCALDVYYTLKLYHVLKAELLRDRGLAQVFKYIMMPGERVLQKIEQNGIYVNQIRLKEVKEEYTSKSKLAESTIQGLLPEKWGGKINANSPKQLAELLFNDLKLPIIDKTPTGSPSTGKATLLRLVDKHPLPSLILDMRTYEKAINGFLTPWEEYLKDGDGRLHTTYNIANTSTGRLSAEDPNLQQVPRDKKIRGLISAPPGRKFINADYSQIELRAAAFIAGAESMKIAYRRGDDIHRKTAARVAHVSESSVTYEQRTAAKAVNFGFLFGMWWKSFKSYAFDSYGVIVTDKEAENARIAYFELYPELVAWHRRQVREVQQYRAVRTPTGRIRHLPDIDSPDKDLRGRAERQAINTPVQSFASDMTLLAMIVIDSKIEEMYPGKAMLVGQVHDAIMLEVDEDVALEVGKLVKQCMEIVPKVLAKYFRIKLDLPIVADVEIGSAWGNGETL